MCNRARTMKLALSTLMAATLIVAGCKDNNADPTATTGVDGAADNTKVNARDRGSNATPMDQGNSQADIDRTAQIRKSLMSDDSLSTDAKNVKVITANGKVVLRGPVKSDAEKTSVGAKAAAVAGADHVENDLDIVTK